MLGTREVCELESLCPAAMYVGETIAGSGVLCRVTGRLVTTGRDPSSLRAFCCCPVPQAQDITADGEEVLLGYINCPVWRYRREQDLREKHEWPENTPERVKQGFAEANMINPAA